MGYEVKISGSERQCTERQREDLISTEGHFAKVVEAF
jgi:hypothetical protein